MINYYKYMQSYVKNSRVYLSKNYKKWVPRHSKSFLRNLKHSVSTLGAIFYGILE